MRIKLNLPGTSPAFALFLTFTISPSTVFAQGSLTPPGPPGLTMKTLSQMEPRLPVSSVPFTITTFGSYYLTTNLTVNGSSAITIATNGVTLDLSGFTISSTSPGAFGYGILINSGLRNITIANGFIQSGVTNNGSGVYSGNGFNYGIYFSGTEPVNVLISRISVCGCLNHGIFLNSDDSTVVESCKVRTVGGTGICASTIKQSSAIDCGATAIDGNQVYDCRGQGSSTGYGVVAVTAQNCYGSSGGNSIGLFAGIAVNCYGSSSSGVGLDAYAALNCYGSCDTNNAGVAAQIAQNCIGTSDGGDGVSTLYTAENCEGYNSGGGYGVFSGYIASGCYGYCSSGIGLDAFIANVCHGATSSGTPLSTSHNVNSF
jgi:hypothetical protein